MKNPNRQAYAILKRKCYWIVVQLSALTQQPYTSEKEK